MAARPGFFDGKPLEALSAAGDPEVLRWLYGFDAGALAPARALGHFRC